MHAACEVGDVPSTAPSVDVIVCTHRDGKYLREALDSVAAQTYTNHRLIVVANGAPDPAAIEREAARVPGSLFVSLAAADLTGARNTGLRAGTGDLVAYLDDDDAWLPERLERQVGAWLRQPEAVGVYSGFRLIDSTGAPLGPGWRVEQVPSASIISGEAVPPFIGTLLVRRDICNSLGGFDPALPYGEDDDFVLRVAQQGELLALPAELMLYRRHAENLTTAGFPIARRRAGTQLIRRQIASAERRGDSETAQLLERKLARYRREVADASAAAIVDSVRRTDLRALGPEVAHATSAPFLVAQALVRRATGSLGARESSSRPLPEPGGGATQPRAPATATPQVEFVINTFERNIDLVTAPGFLTNAVAQHCYPFALRTLLVNNVRDRPTAERQAAAAVDRGEIDRFLFVEDLLDGGLRTTKLRRRDFGRYLHWSDCCLAALVADGPELLCYVDVDVRLAEPRDWIAPALAVMNVDPRVAVGSPNWVMADGTATVHVESDRAGDGFAVGYGITDQVFLTRRSTFARPLRTRGLPLSFTCPASARYPGTDGSLFFEQIADAYMRRHRLMRVTVTAAQFEPIPMSDYSSVSLVDRVRHKRDRLALQGATALRSRWPSLVTSPRLRTTGLLDPAYSRAPVRSRGERR